MPSNTVFREVTHINQATVSDQLETNLMAFFSYGFLNIGGFVNVIVGTSGTYGGQPWKLRPSSDHRYTSGQVWEGYRKDWIWESGIECGTQPIAISGIFINSTFYPISTTGTYAYKIDYPHGRIIFNNAISTTSTVICEHSYRYVQITNPDAPWYKRLQENSFRIDSPQFQMSGSGQWNLPPEQRVQMPAIIIEAYPNVQRRGFEIGGLSQKHRQEIRYHILTETRADFKFLHDTVIGQNEKSLIGFDKNAMIRATGFPLNYDGSVAANAKTYPNLIKPANQGGFEWRTIRFDGIRSWLDHTGAQNYEAKPSLIKGVVAGIVEVIVP